MNLSRVHQSLMGIYKISIYIQVCRCMGICRYLYIYECVCVCVCRKLAVIVKHKSKSSVMSIRLQASAATTYTYTGKMQLRLWKDIKGVIKCLHFNVCQVRASCSAAGCLELTDKSYLRLMSGGNQNLWLNISTIIIWQGADVFLFFFEELRRLPDNSFQLKAVDFDDSDSVTNESWQEGFFFVKDRVPLPSPSLFSSSKELNSFNGVQQESKNQTVKRKKNIYIFYLDFSQQYSVKMSDNSVATHYRPN